jgi:hypothetical protein
MKRTFQVATLLSGLLLLAGCTPLSVTMAGVGASLGLSHQLDGLAAKTFTAPLPRTRKASLAALRNMGIRVESTEKTDKGEVIKAKTADRNIEVELDALTPSVTRMRAVARKDILLVDGATAEEIIAQTARALGAS